VLFEKALGILDGLLPNTGQRDAVKAQIRLAALASTSHWGPQGVLATAAGLSMIAYLDLIAFKGVPIIWVVLGAQFFLTAILLGLDIGSAAKVWDRIKKEK